MSLIKKIFGLGGAPTAKVGNVEIEDIVTKQLDEILERLNMDVEFHLEEVEEKVRVEFDGPDTERLLEKDANLLDALQFYIKRVLQHSLPESRINIEFDAGNYREEAMQNLVELADRLKGIALDRNKSVYFRALPPKERKIVHQHLAKDDRVKSKSVGEGVYKKIKVFPAGMKSNKGSRNRRANP